MNMSLNLQGHFRKAPQDHIRRTSPLMTQRPRLSTAPAYFNMFMPKLFKNGICAICLVSTYRHFSNKHPISLISNFIDFLSIPTKKHLIHPINPAKLAFPCKTRQNPLGSSSLWLLRHLIRRLGPGRQADHILRRLHRVMPRVWRKPAAKDVPVGASFEALK